MEQLEYNLPFRWFMNLNMDDPVWDMTVFTKNRDRLIEGEVAQEFFNQVLAQAQAASLLSSEHFTVNRTLIEAWASHKSFKRKDGALAQEPPDDPGNPTVDFHREKRSNATHQSTIDPECRLYKKFQDGAVADRIQSKSLLWSCPWPPARATGWRFTLNRFCESTGRSARSRDVMNGLC